MNTSVLLYDTVYSSVVKISGCDVVVLLYNGLTMTSSACLTISAVFASNSAFRRLEKETDCISVAMHRPTFIQWHALS